MADPKQNNSERDPFDVLLAGVREFARTTNEETGREVLTAAVKQYLAELDADQFAALVAEVREPADPPGDTGPAYPASWGYQPR